MNYKDLVLKSKELRKKHFKPSLKLEAHLGGSFSMIEFIIILFYKIIKNDKFIYKSHASYPLCLILETKV